MIGPDDLKSNLNNSMKDLQAAAMGFALSLQAKQSVCVPLLFCVCVCFIWRE